MPKQEYEQYRARTQQQQQRTAENDGLPTAPPADPMGYPDPNQAIHGLAPDQPGAARRIVAEAQRVAGQLAQGAARAAAEEIARTAVQQTVGQVFEGRILWPITCTLVPEGDAAIRKNESAVISWGGKFLVAPLWAQPILAIGLLRYCSFLP